MSQGDTSAAENFSDLGFDMERHREALNSFAKMELEVASVRPALRARDLVFVRVPSGPFRIGVTENLSAQEAVETTRGCTGFAVIHQARTPEEARQIRAEVERYFLRHFPGRTMTKMDEADPSQAGGHGVYVVCYPPSAPDAV